MAYWLDKDKQRHTPIRFRTQSGKTTAMEIQEERADAE
jgi:hypothetical protein